MDFAGFKAAGGNVSRETFDALARYAALLSRWNRRINLVAPKTLPDLWTRHVLDSLQITGLVRGEPRHWLDLGSGGGLPGLIVAIALRDRRTRFTLIESDRRKATFLRTIARELDLNVTVNAERIEEVEPQEADIVSARALAPLSQLLSHHMRHSAGDGIGLYLKGATAEAEISDALERWQFSCEKIPSSTSADSFVLKIGDLKRA